MTDCARLLLMVCLPLLLGSPSVSAGEAAPLVAVLEFQQKVKGADKDLIDPGYFANVVRSAVLSAAPRAKVMTKENMLVLLGVAGKSLSDCEGECEVDTGRRLGADLVVSGDLLRIGKNFKLDLRMHETKEGRLVSGAQASGASVEELDSAVGAAVTKLVAPLTGSPARATQGSADAAAAQVPAPAPVEVSPFASGRAISGTWSIKGGRLYGNGGHYFFDEEFEDGSLDVDIEYLSGGAGHAVGMVFRGRAEDKTMLGYYLNYTHAGTYNFYNCVGANSCYVLTSGWAAGKGYKPVAGIDEARNHLRIEAKGKAWRALLNGKLIDQGTDGGNRLGGYGLVVETGAQARFSNLKVSRLP